MFVSQPYGGGTPSACSLVDSRKDLETPESSSQQPQKPDVAPAAADTAPVAFATDDFADLVWPSNYGAISAEDEEAEVLNDLLHLGLELGDLECVFGDTDCASSSDISGSNIHRAGAGESEGRDEDTGRVAEEEVAGHFGHYEGGAAEELVPLDADLQDALLSLRDLDAESTGDDTLFTDDSVQETSIDYSTCGNTSDDTAGCCNHETVGCWAFDTTVTPSTDDIEVVLDVEHCTTPSPSATPSAAAASKDPGHVIILESLTDRRRQDPPGVFVEGEDLLADFDATGAATGMHQEAAAAAEGLAPFPAAVLAGGLAAGISLSGSDGSMGGEDSWKSGHIDEEIDARTYETSTGVTVAPTPTLPTPAASAAGTAGPASPAAVPTRLLDAIDLWESANAHAIAKKKAAAVAAAAAAREHARATRAKKGCNTASNTASIAKSRNKKKKNEFGKRRRSSGGGDQGAPVLETPNTAAAGAAGTTPGKTKGKSHGRGKGKDKGKKVDPLVRIRDARHLSRKPLIVQWLKSDGCDSDEEAEAALGKAVGSLSAISRYWSRGG